jgi:plastocyanin
VIIGVRFAMKKFAIPASALLLAAFSGLAGNAQAQKWADLTMTVVLDGDAPAPKLLDMSADPKCGNVKVPSDEFIVDPKSKGIANVLFMINTRSQELDKSMIHPDLQSVPKSKPVLDNNKCKFVPHILAVRAGQTINVTNTDEAGHNAKFNFFANQEVNPMIPAGGSKEIPTEVEEKSPTKVDCNIHPWMNAYVVVTKHPYVGISDAQGKIKIEKLPAGVPLEFRIWHEIQDKSIEEVVFNGSKDTWKKGYVTLTLKEGVNDFGKLLIKPNRFKTK